MELACRLSIIRDTLGVAMCHRYQCPFCSQRFVQQENLEGPNFCPTCRRLFLVPRPRPVPPWILGVVVILLANWLIYFQHVAA